jgi:predicted ribosomally synthesized peptide with SipW-like signal peptide
VIKKVIGLTIALILLLGISGIGTYAYFSDVETSSENVLAAGTLDLKTDDVDGVSQTLLASNIMPGDTVGPETIILKNSGTVAGSSLDLSFSYTESDSSPNPADMTANATAAILQVTTLNYDSSSLLSSVSDNNSNGYKDVYDLSTANLTGLAGIGASSTKDFEIAVTLRSDASKDFQADGIDVTMHFILNQ